MSKLPVVVNPARPMGRGHKDEDDRSPNPFIKPADWKRLQRNGTMAAERLGVILASPNFHRLPIKEQLLAIKVAQDAATRPMMKAETIVNVNNGDSSGNAIKRLAAQATLPEFTKSRQVN